VTAGQTPAATQRGGRVAVVTGGGSGIGLATCARLAQDGFSVAALDLRPAAAAGAAALTVSCDVTDESDVTMAMATVAGQLGGIDVLVNNAGIGRYLAFLESGPEDVAAIFETNLHAALHFTRAVLPGMLARRRGHLVNVASIAARIGSRNHSIYCASKFALAGFSESLGLELEGSGVGVTLVNPGIVATAFFDDASFAGFPAGARARAISPERVAAAVVRAIRRDVSEVTVPASYALGTLLKAAAPGLFRRLMRRFA
jgi:short-subunit dehydrogenase